MYVLYEILGLIVKVSRPLNQIYPCQNDDKINSSILLYLTLHSNAVELGFSTGSAYYSALGIFANDMRPTKQAHTLTIKANI